MSIFSNKKSASSQRSTKNATQNATPKHSASALLKPLTIKSRNGLFSSGLIALSVAIVLVLNLAVAQLPEGVRKFDLSSSKAFSISDVTTDYVDGLTKEIEITVVATKDSTDSRMVSFFQRYSDLSDYITLNWVDPITIPSALTKYDCSADTVVVSCEAMGQTRKIPFSDIMVMDEMSYYYYGTTNYTSFDGEGQLTSAIDYVVSNVSHKLYTTENHGENALGTALSDRLSKNHFTTDSLSLLQTGGVPDDCDLLIINAPSADFSAEECKLVEDYLNKGGKVNLLLGDMSFSHPNLDTLLTSYGLSVTESYVGDSSRYYPAAQSYFAFFPELSTSSAAAEGVNADALVLILNSYGVTEMDALPEDVTLDPFLQTASGIMDNGTDNPTTGTYLLGVTATKALSDTSDAVLTVCAESLTNDAISQQFGDSVANLTVFTNTIATQFNDVSNISIESKSLETPTNTMTNAGLWGMLFVAILPLSVLLLGGFRWWKRRHL